MILITIISATVASQEQFRIFEGTTTVTLSEDGYFIPDTIYWGMKEDIELGMMWKEKYDELEKIAIAYPRGNDFWMGFGCGMVGFIVIMGSVL